MATAAPAHPPTAAPAPPLRVASFPPVIPQNRYQGALYEAMAAEGGSLVEDARLSLRWLLRRRRDVDVLHFHWPQGYWRHGDDGASPLGWVKVALLAVRLAAARAMGVRIAWTVHQPLPHERARRGLDRAGGLVLAHAANVLIAHDRASAARAARVLRVAESRIAIVPHGSYDGQYPPGRARAVVRGELGLRDDEVALLCFGHIRAYKGLELVLEAFERAPARCALVVAGLVLDEDAASALRDAAARDPRIRLRLEFIPDERVAELHAACDAAICPRSDGGTSGVLALALDLGLPVIAADADAYRDLAGSADGTWWFAPGDAASLAEAIDAAVAADGDERAARGRRNRALTAQRGWPDIARRTAALLRGGDGRAG